MATAIFNQEINASSDSRSDAKYDLYKVLTLTGFDIETINFKLVSTPSDNVYIEEGSLFVGYGVYGTISIDVYDKMDNSARASTNIKASYGYFYQRYFSKGSNPQTYRKVTQENWSNIISNGSETPKKDKEIVVK